MIKFFENILQFLSEKSMGHSLIAFLILILLINAFNPLIEGFSKNLLSKRNLSSNNYVCVQVCIVGITIFIVTMGIYFLAKKLIFVWLLCSIASIIGGILGLIPISFISKRKK